MERGLRESSRLTEGRHGLGVSDGLASSGRSGDEEGRHPKGSIGSASKTNHPHGCYQGQAYYPQKTQKALNNQGFEYGGSVEIRTLG